MTDSYTRLAKPTGTPYTILRAPGSIIYDDPMYEYDSPILAYDGGDGSTYTSIPKPTGSVYTKIAKPII